MNKELRSFNKCLNLSDCDVYFLRNVGSKWITSLWCGHYPGHDYSLPSLFTWWSGCSARLEIILHQKFQTVIPPAPTIFLCWCGSFFLPLFFYLKLIFYFSTMLNMLKTLIIQINKPLHFSQFFLIFCFSWKHPLNSRRVEYSKHLGKEQSIYSFLLKLEQILSAYISQTLFELSYWNYHVNYCIKDMMQKWPESTENNLNAFIVKLFNIETLLIPPTKITTNSF